MLVYYDQNVFHKLTFICTLTITMYNIIITFIVEKLFLFIRKEEELAFVVLKCQCAQHTYLHTWALEHF